MNQAIRTMRCTVTERTKPFRDTDFDLQIEAFGDEKAEQSARLMIASFFAYIWGSHVDVTFHSTIDDVDTINQTEED